MPIDEDQRQGEGLRILMAVVRRFWPVLLIATIVGALCGFGWAALQPKMYQSTSSGLIVTPKSSTIGEAIAGNSLAQDRAGSYAVMASSQRTGERAVEKLTELGVADVPPAGALIGSITAAVVDGTTELRVTARASDPAFAQQLANVWIQALAEEAHNIESTGVNGVDEDFQPAVELMPMTEGTLPTSPYAPNVNQAVLMGAVVGLVLGLIWAAIKHLLDRRVRSVEAIQKVGMSAVGTLPSDPRLSRGRQVLPVVYSAETRTDRNYHAYSEALRELRTNLAYMDVDNPPRVIVVTSSVPGEGKSSLSANLAVTIAQTGQKVIVVDGDLRRPVISEMFSLPGDAGLTDVLAGQAELDDVLQDFEPVPNLQVLAAGRIPPNPSELLASKTMRKLLEDLSERAFVIIDAPPLLPVTDGAVLAKVSDGALIVVKAGKPTIDELAKATENLDRVGANKLGVILNQVPTRGAEASRYGYYGKYYSKKETKAKTTAEVPGASVTDNPPTEQIQTPATSASHSRHTEVTQGTSSQSMTATKPSSDNFDEIVFRGTRAKRSDES